MTVYIKSCFVLLYNGVPRLISMLIVSLKTKFVIFFLLAINYIKSFLKLFAQANFKKKLNIHVAFHESILWS